MAHTSIEQCLVILEDEMGMLKLHIKMYHLVDGKELTMEALRPKYSALADYVFYPLQNHLTTIHAMARVLGMSKEEIEAIWNK